MHHVRRVIHRSFFLFMIMACALMTLVLYSLSLSCCIVVSSGLKQALRHGARVIVLDDDDTDAQKHPDTGDLAGQGRPGHIFRAFTRTEEDQLNGYLGDIVYHHDDNKDYPSRSTSEHRTNTGLPKEGPRQTRYDTKSGSRKLPQALIIGVKKGGTRALLEFLRVHPDIRAPGPETHFFDKNYDKGIDWYRSQMPATLDDQMTMEKTPSYFVTREVPERVFNMSRDIKLLLVVRDPVTRAISDYTQAVSKRPDVKPFEEMAFIDNRTGLVDTSWGAIRIGEYAKHLERWLKFFPLEQIHFINGENLIQDPAQELNRVQQFLGLKNVINEKHFYFNSTKGFPCLKKPEGSGNPHCLGKTKGRQHPDIDPKVIKRLKDFFRPFNAKFYQMVGQDFGWD